MINVTRPYLPDRAKLNAYIDTIYETAWLTNNGPLVRELTERLEKYLYVENLLLVSNGTTALQIAYRVLGISEEVITTPFSFVATTSSLVWEGLRPVFVDIDPDTYCINFSKIEEVITSETTAIVPVHVFGNACNIENIETIAGKHGLKTVYDGAHAFGVQYNGKSIFSYGDATTISFHATKLFHTIEGGAIIFKKKEDFEKAKKMIEFGIDDNGGITEVGINAKMNEFQAAMGLCVLDEMDTIINERFIQWNYYKSTLGKYVRLQKRNVYCNNNFSYFPILFKSKDVMYKVKFVLQEAGINTRRYFYPSLDTIGYLDSDSYQKISYDVSNRILCLPIYPGLSSTEQARICNLLLSCIKEDD